MKLEEAVIAASTSFLNDPNSLRRWMDDLPDEEQQQAISMACHHASQLQSSVGVTLKKVLASLRLKLQVEKSSIVAELDLACIIGADRNVGQPKTLARIEIPTIASWNGHEKRLKLAPPSGPASNRNEPLIDLIARAFDARDSLLAMDNADLSATPVRHRRHLERTARLSNLAPDIVLAIINGEQPSHLSARKLFRTASLPRDWAAQRQMLLAR